MKLKYILFIIILIAASSNSFATSYTWVGTSSSWNLSSNWSPSGIPDSADNVTIGSGTYSPLLDGNKKITNLTLSSKTIDLNGYSLTVYGTATMTSGTVTNGTFYARGNLASFNGTLMDCPVDAICGYIRLSGSTFNETADFTDLGTATGTGSGGCTFNDDVTITHTGTLTYFTLANSTGDTFNGNVTFTNNSNREIHIASSGATLFNGNVILNSTSSGGISFANGGGSATLATGKTISIGTSGFSADFLTLKNFTQNGSTAQTLTLTGTAVVNMIAAIFNGNITVTAPGILLKNSTFNGTTTLTRNGSSGNHQSDGGNMFNLLTLDNAGSSGRIRWATTLPDTYNADATFNSTGGQDVQIAYSGDNTFAGNITINSNKVVFNTSTGKVTFTGTNNQTLNGSYNYPFKKLAINKTAGTVTANTTLSVDDSLIFIQGNLITTSTNLLTMKHGSSATGASNSSFVSGPVKKVGNAAFVYPVGANYSYRPIQISTPSTTTSEFIGEFVEDTALVHSVSRDASLGYLNRIHYWKLNRTSGTSQVYVTLSWNEQNALVDTLVTIASWNGTQWSDLGKGTLTGSTVSGTLTSLTAATSYNEFTLGYISGSMLSGPCDCGDVSDPGCLEFCLMHTLSNTLIEVSGSIDLTGQSTWSGLFPLTVSAGVTLQSKVGANSPKWWEANCPLISTDHEAIYTNTTESNRRSLFVFAMEPGATIQNLRIRGADCNYKDNNLYNSLSGGIHIDNGSGTATISNCEISCFSLSGIWKSDQPELLTISNCYIHKVKGTQQTYGIGYGVWTQSTYFPLTPLEINFQNNIFDDCKAALDGQGKIVNWNINHCSFTQFFSSEDINMHNDNRFKINESNDPNEPNPYDYHLCYSGAFCSSNCFYGIYCPNTVTSCTTSTCTTFASYQTNWLNCNSIGNHLPIYDVGGAQTTIQNCIFHRKIDLDQGQSNITLPYPNTDPNPSKWGDNGNFVHILHNTFTIEELTTLKLDVLNQGSGSIKNRGGFARIADNSINACVWSNDNHLVHNNNNFSYVPGMTFTNSPIPCSNEVTLTNSTNVLLPPTHTKSANANHSMIQYVDVNTSFKINTTSNAVSPVFIVRTNPNTLASPLISNENYFYDQEIFTSAATYTFGGYNKPGLYGIDVLAFDVQDLNSGTPEEYNFRSSAWNHIPVIVKGATEQTLYFNIKDSYEQDAGPTGVRKQAYLNDLLIWEEDISQGGTGWEYIEVDLRGLAVDQVTEIFSALKTDGTPNILSFSISIAASVSSVDVAGLYVWIDDVYIPVTGSANGDNLIKDGTVELTKSACSTCDWFINTSGNANVTGCGSTSAGVHEKEKKSGNRAIYLNVPNNNNCTFTTTDRIVASVGTNIDFTGILNCGDYTSSPFNYTEMDYIISTPVTKSGAYFMANDIVIQQGGKLTLSSCSLVVMPHNPPYRILIESGGELTLISTATNATRIYSCEDMWGGIVSTNGTILSTSTHKSKVEDAITAFDCEGGNIQVRNIEFKNCWQSFNLHATSTNQFTSSSFVRGCKFYLSDHVLTKSPHEDEIPFVHMELNNISNFSFPIGNNVAGLKNEFHNATNGIIVRNSLFTLYNNYFYNIHSVVSLNSGTRNYGRGVSIFNTTLAGGTTLLGGSGTNEGNFFENVNLGIQIYNSCPTCNYTITNNRLDNTNYGEKGIGTSFYNTAITVQGPATSTGVVEVYGNIIDDYRIGIHARNIPDISIGSKPTLSAPNIINFNQTEFNDHHRGIWVENSNGAKVQDNEIHQTSTAIPSGSNTVEGITIDNCQNAVLTSNELYELYSPIRLKNTCLLTELHCNDIDNDLNSGGTGVNIDGADISPQGISSTETWENTWKGYSTSINGVVGTPAQQTFWYYDPLLANGNPFPHPSSVNPQGTTPTIAETCSLNIIIDVHERDAQFGKVVADSMNYSYSAEELEYKSRTHLFNLIKSDTTLLTKSTAKDSLFRNFYSGVEQLNIGIFYKIDSLILEGNLDAAADLNNSITDSLEWESNLKAVYSIIINKTLRDSLLNASDTTVLEEIAFQNPMDGGRAVFWARVLLFMEIHDETISARIGSINSSLNITHQKDSTTIQLFPNPANDQCQVVVTGIKKDFIVRVKDIVGQDLYIKSIASEINLINIDTSFMTPGMYILIVTDGVEFFKQEKIVISR
jgi:hypothetical protein